MKIVEKTKVKKKEMKHKSGIKPKKGHVLIVAQEIKFARLLSSNEKKIRDRALKTLKKWLLNCFDKGYEFKETDFSRIWKGLFYAVWMSDKPLVQEELCESIASLLDIFPADRLRAAVMLVKVGFRALATEWFGIDQHRMDKFLMLVRRYLRGSLRCLKRCDWSLHSCNMYSKMLSSSDGILAPKTPGYALNATSMILHIIDCYLEEIAKVSEGTIPAASLSGLLRPVCQYMCHGVSPTVVVASRRLLTQLVRQSDAGDRYADKTRAWEQMGCPEGGPDALELVSDEDEDDENSDENGDEQDSDDGQERPLDPRAGRVDVLLPSLPVPCEQIAEMLREMIVKTTSKAHKRAKICLQRFEQLSRDEYPLKMPDSVVEFGEPLPKRRAAANSLRALEKKLVTQSDELALRGLSRKHRKRLLAKSRAGLSIVEEVGANSEASATSQNDSWLVEETEPEKKKDTSNKENVNKQKKNKKRKLTPERGDGDAKKQRADSKIKVDSSGKEVAKHKNNKADEKKATVKSESKLTNGVAKDKHSPAVIKYTKKATNEKQKVNEAKGKPKKIEHRHTEQKNVTSNKITKIKPSLVVSKVKNFQKQLTSDKNAEKNVSVLTPKKVKFVLKNNSMQETMDYYKSVRQSPSIPFDSSKKPVKTNLKPSTPSPINPFFKKKLKLK